MEQSDEAGEDRELPFVTLSYAQSLDGSIAALRGHPLAISGLNSAALAHSLRAAHDGILVGIGTVLSDDPRLTVRMVSGADPQPIILDSRLRFPLDAKLLHNGGSRVPWIVATEKVEQDRETALTRSGAHVMRVVADAKGRIDLLSLLLTVKKSGIRTLLVEGGSRVITSFLMARLVNQVVITIAPRILGGLRAPDSLLRENGIFYPRFRNVFYEPVGQDLVLRGDPFWDDIA